MNYCDESCVVVKLFSKIVSNASTSKAICDDLGLWFEVVIEFDQPLCSQRLHNAQPQINWRHRFFLVKLLADLLSILLLKLLL